MSLQVQIGDREKKDWQFSPTCFKYCILIEYLRSNKAKRSGDTDTNDGLLQLPREGGTARHGTTEGSPGIGHQGEREPLLQFLWEEAGKAP